MKLYATITSNRAMKGQGGDWLKIIIRNDKQHCIAYINVRNGEKIDIDVLDKIQLGIERPIQICTDDDHKGERQKGE